MSISEKVEFLKNNWAAFAVAFCVSASVIFPFLNYIYQNRFEEKEAKVQSLEVQLRDAKKIGPTHMQGTEQQRQEVSFLYAEMFEKGASVVISNPPVYKYVNKGEYSMIDSASIEEVRVAATDGDIAPRAVKSNAQYTGVGEAIALGNIQALFARLSPKKELLSVDQARLYDHKAKHIILLGGWVSNVVSEMFIASPAFHKYQRRIPYQLHDGFLSEYDPQTGNERRKFSPEYEIVKGELVPKVEWALVTRVQHPYHNTVVIIAAGINSQGT